MATPPVKNIAIIGISGRIGGAFAKELLKSGKHNISALTRKDSPAAVPEGVTAIKVDYDDENSILEALKGQQFLIITLSVRAPQDLQSKIINLAVKSGVSYIMPNTYGYDPANENITAEPLFAHYGNSRKLIQSLGASSVLLCCGYWYEWSLALGEQWFGFDIKNRKVWLYDDGETKINVSTWDQCGRAIGALLDLPESGAKPSLADWKNGVVYSSSWKLSQRDMLDSLHRVLGTTDKDWTIEHKSSVEAYNTAMTDLSVMTNFAQAIYSRIFRPTGDGDFESTRGLANEVLGLPKEDLDKHTKIAVEMVESGWTPFA
jgi:uncharacterized protein YbjT (DUF2867 family)